jgi:excisionase family DNA binding protein
VSHHYLRAEEVEPVMAALDPRWRSLFACAVYLGLRRGELAALRKTSVDLERRELAVEASWGRTTTKGGHGDVLPIPEALVPFLQAAMDASPIELVFPDTNGKMMKVDIKLQHVLRRALARADIVLGYVHRCRGRKGQPCRHEEAHPDRAPRRCPTHGILLWPKARVRPVRWHDLRHSTASLLNVAGVPLAEAQKILRHNDPKLTAEIYTHVEKTRLRAAANSMPISVGHLVPQRVVDRMLTGAAKAESGAADQEKSPGVTEAWSSGKRDLNPRPSPWQFSAKQIRLRSIPSKSVRVRATSRGWRIARHGRLSRIVRHGPQNAGPALHQTTTPGALPFLLMEAPSLSVLLTVGEVAERLKLSRATVYGLVKRGELPSIRVSNSIRVRSDAVEALASGPTVP